MQNDQKTCVPQYRQPVNTSLIFFASNPSNTSDLGKPEKAILTTGFKTSFGCDRLQSSWICVLGKKGSRRTPVRLRALFTSGLDHKLFARSRFKTGFETSCNHLRRPRYDFLAPEARLLVHQNSSGMGIVRYLRSIFGISRKVVRSKSLYNKSLRAPRLSDWQIG